MFARLLLLVTLWGSGQALAGSLPDTIDRIRGSVVGIGTHLPTRAPAAEFGGTGFAVGDGSLIVTNAHVLPEKLNEARKEQLAVLVNATNGPANKPIRVLPASKVAEDDAHDLALLKIEGMRLPALKLAPDDSVREGQDIALTGFPLGIVLGLHPATHRGMVAAISPVVIPQRTSRQLTPRLIRQLRNPFDVLQLDATIFPGNSGSPVYLPDSGEVVGIANMVWVKGTKEAVLSDPSGISYAIPVRYLRALLNKYLAGQ